MTFTQHRKRKACSKGTYEVPGELQSSDRRLLSVGYIRETCYSKAIKVKYSLI